MGWWRVSADTLAASRFVVSPLAETTACLMTLERESGSQPGMREWFEAHHAAYKKRLAEDPIAAMTLRAAFGRHWIADFLTPPPGGDDEFAQVREARPDAVRKDLEISLGGPVPAALQRPDLARRIADLLDWVWAACVQPDWPRRRRILEADVLARTARLGSGGWVAALEGMRPGIRWLGDGRLQINAYNYPPRDIAAAELLFTPVTPGRGWVTWDDSSRYGLIYPCSGLLAEAGRTRAPSALSALIGPERARVLMLLDTPKSTTQLVALTGLALGSVGRHVKTLLESGLVQRRRAGRSVLYSRAHPGDVLVKAQSPDVDGGLAHSAANRHR